MVISGALTTDCISHVELPPTEFEGDHTRLNVQGGFLHIVCSDTQLNKAASATAREFVGDDFVFSMSARDCKAATGITRSQQANCRKALAALGLLSEEGSQRKTPILEEVVRSE